jgi:hypothetical protein
MQNKLTNKWVLNYLKKMNEDQLNQETHFCFILCLVFALGSMSYITTSGYGYRKRICEDVTTWFLNRFFPRHKIHVEILHRGLKREQVYGYCDYVGESYRPRQFLIELGHSYG